MKKITHEYTKRYHIGYEKLLQLNYMERYLLDYLAEKMDEDNKVFTNQAARQEFINFILRISHQTDNEIIYKDNSVKYSLTRLKKLGILITPPESEGRGWCWVSPSMFHRGTEDKRKNMICYIERRLAE